MGLEIRPGMEQFHSSLPENADVVMEIDRSTLESLLVGDMEALGIDGVHAESSESALMAVFQSSNARLTSGTPEDMQRFFSYFDPLSSEPISLTVQ